MSFCTSCGTRLPDYAKFCTNCGAVIPQAAPAPAPEMQRGFEPIPDSALQPDFAPPADAYAPPADAYAPPADAYAPPADAYAPPADAYAPQAGYAPPADAYAPQAGYAPPADGYAPQAGYVDPYGQPYPQQQQMQPAYPPQQGGYYPQQPYGYAPARQLKTNRGLLKFILLSIITLGIYGIVVMSGVSTDINTIASRYDGKKTMHYCLVCFIFSWLTCGIVPLVWSSKISGRIGRELQRRGIDYSFGTGTFWLWCILGSLIVVGPFIYYHKLFKSMNLLSADYNVRG